MNHDLGSELLRTRARRAYELGRVRGALWRASLLSLASAALGALLVDERAWRWMPLTFVLWLFTWWRGGALLDGARYGLAAGAVTFLLPVSLLRPCCRAGMAGMAPVCTMPEMCVLAGAVVGLPLAALVLRKRASSRVELGLGMMLGVVSLAAVKCSALFLGEALGLFGGLLLGIAAAGGLEALAARRAA